MANDTTPYSTRVAGAVKAELARRDLDRAALAPVLGYDRNAVYARLRGERPFTTSELQLIAQYLDVPLAILVDPADYAVPATKAVA